MSVINAAMSFKNKSLISRFRVNDDRGTNATLVLSSLVEIVIHVPYDYIVGDAALNEAVNQVPKPDYIMLNTWSKRTAGLQDSAKRRGIRLVEYGELIRILEKRNGWD